MRRMLSMLSAGGGIDSDAASERVLEYLKKSKKNTDFLMTLKDMGKDIVRS